MHIFIDVIVIDGMRSLYGILSNLMLMFVETCLIIDE